MNRIGSLFRRVILRLIGCDIDAIPLAVMTPGQVIALQIVDLPHYEVIEAMSRQLKAKGIQVVWIGPGTVIQPLQADVAYRLVTHPSVNSRIIKEFMRLWHELEASGSVGSLVVTPENTALIAIDDVNEGSNVISEESDK